MPGRQQAVIYVYFKTGSRFETESENGLSHFVEHMLFRGTHQNDSSHRLAMAFESLGGTLQAATAADHGSLGISVPRENVERVIPLMAEVFQSPTFRDVDIERRIIVEEILEDLSEEGEMVDLASLSRRLAFEGSSLAYPITGPVHNVEQFSLEQLRAHHHRTYVGTDAVISIAGPVDAERIIAQVQNAFGSIPRGSGLLETASSSRQTAPRFEHVNHPGSSQTSLSLAYRCPGRTAPEQAALDMLLRVIDDGMSTRLYHEICDARGLCYSIAGSYELYQDVGIIEFEADTAHERAPVVLEQLLRITSELRETLVSEDEFTRIVNRTRWQYESLLDDVNEVADFFAAAAVSGTAATPELRLEELLSVTREQVRDVAAAVFVPEGRNVITVGTQKKSGRSQLERLTLSS